MNQTEIKSFKSSISRFVILSVFLLILAYPHIEGTSIRGIQPSAVALSPQVVPVLRQGDVWHYLLGVEGNSTQSILRIVACGNAKCVVSREVNGANNDTRWIVPGNWSLVKDYCVGCDGSNVITNTSYTPPRPLFAFPVQPGETWWWNGTASGRTSTPNGITNFSVSVSILEKVINETSVTVHAGTFDTFLVAQYDQNGTLLDGYSWFSPEAATAVKAVSLNSNGIVIDSRELTSYRIVGVNPGQFLRLGSFSVAYKSNDTNPELSATALSDLDSVETSVQNVTGSRVTFEALSFFKNGTQISTTNTTDISKGLPTPTPLGPLIIEAGLRGGTAIPNWQGMSINYTKSISYLGTFREVDILNSTQAVQPPSSGWIRLVRYWDRFSGFLLATQTEINETYSRNGSSYFLVESTSARVVSTNVWQAFLPGLKVGGWAKYGDFSGSWTSNIPGDQNTSQFYHDVYWQTETVQEVSGTSVTLESTIALANATAYRESVLAGNLLTGTGNLTSSCLLPCVLAGNLRAGDPVFDSSYSATAAKINQTLDRVYLGVHRRVDILNITSTLPTPYNSSIRNVGIYDQATGMLLEFISTNSWSYQNYTRVSSAHYRMTETNLWNATRLPDFSITASPPLLSLRPGSSGATRVSLTSIHGFADSVNIAATVSPTGPRLGPIPGRLIVAASPVFTTASFFLNVSTTSDLPTGTFNVTVTGSSGLITHTLSFTVLVYRPLPVECGTRDVCYIVSNVTISDVKSSGNTIHFTAVGPHGIIGNANVTIPVTSLSDPDTLQIVIDKALLPASSVQIDLDLTGHSYLVHFTFEIHGAVNVDLLLGGIQPAITQPFLQLSPSNLGILGVSATIMGSLGVEGLRKVRAWRRAKRSPEPSAEEDKSPRWSEN